MDSFQSYCLFLNHLFYDSPRYQLRFLNQFSDRKAFDDHWQSYAEAQHFAESVIARIRSRIASFFVSKLQRQLENESVRFVCIRDGDYPDWLKHIADPPVVLFYRGDICLLKRLCLGVVGPRQMTQYGREVTRHFVTALAPHFVIVSGMAAGVDTVAHQSAVDGHFPTVAVVATGLRYVYPVSNKALCESVARTGLVLSEYPLDVTVKPYLFPQRNRIISGVSQGVLVCEASEKSGAMITARLAMEQGRDVFAVPGSVFSDFSVGVHRLIQDGAKLVHQVSDVLEEFPQLDTLFAGAYTEALPTHDTVLKTERLDSMVAQLSEEEKRLFSVLTAHPLHVDELHVQSQLPVYQVLQFLTLFEFKGLVEQLPGQWFRLKV